MSTPKLKVSHHCGGCGKFFVEGFEFPEKYHCEDCSEYWDKEDGRNCPQCHKFGANPDEPVCPNCCQEVEPEKKQVSPDDEEVVGQDGGVIMTKKRVRARKVSQAERDKTEAERAARREKYTAILKRDIAEHVVDDGSTLSSLLDESIIAVKRITALDCVVNIFATASLSSGFWFDGTGLPFELSFTVTSNGYEGKYRSSGGFSFSCADKQEFDNVEALVTEAKRRMATVAFKGD